MPPMKSSLSHKQRGGMDDDLDRIRRRTGKATTSTSGVSEASFLDLKAEVARRRGDASGAEMGAKQKIRKKRLSANLLPTSEALNRGSRTKDKSTTSDWAKTPSAQLDAARAALERKSKMYDKLQRGLHGGVEDVNATLSAGLIDWDQKEIERELHEEENEHTASDDAAESAEEAEEPLEEFTDEFGRTRLLPRSQVPRRHLNTEETDIGEVIYGPQAHFPVRPRSPVSHKATSAGLDKFYDASDEPRAQAAGYYKLSKDAEARRKQHAALQELREETKRRRLDDDASSSNPASGEERSSGSSGPNGQSSSSAIRKSRPLTAAEKRKAQRRIELDSIRQAKLGTEEAARRQTALVDTFLDSIVSTANPSADSAPPF